MRSDIERRIKNQDGRFIGEELSCGHKYMFLDGRIPGQAQSRICRECPPGPAFNRQRQQNYYSTHKRRPPE